MKMRRSIYLISALFLLVLSFQNCTKTSPQAVFSSESTAKFSNQESDSGQPYDGKTYIFLGPQCLDGYEVDSRITLKSTGEAILDREKCKYIQPVTLAATDIQLDPANSEILTYKNQNFMYAPPPDLGLTDFSISGDAINFTFSFSYFGSPLFKQVYLDIDDSNGTGFSIATIGADYLLENNNLFQYSGSNGAWGWTRIGSSNMLSVDPNVSWTVARTSVGSPPKIRALASTTLGYYSKVVEQ